MSRTRLSTVVFDAPDAHELADFYMRLLGYVLRAEEPDWVLIGPRSKAPRSPSRPSRSTHRPCGPRGPATSG